MSLAGGSQQLRLSRPADMQTCTNCGRPLVAPVRYCPTCGALVDTPDQPNEIYVSGPRQFRTEGDTFSLESVAALVHASVGWWQQQIQTGDAATRAAAAEAIQQLSQILASLSQQLMQGRDVVRITTRLPQVRRYERPCPRCGYGNRKAAQFCRVCGAPLQTTSAVLPQPSTLKVVVAACTDTGRRRSVNQDVALAEQVVTADDRPITLLLVADGMGGAQAGDTASALAASTVRAELLVQLVAQPPAAEDDTAWQALLAAAVQSANTQVYQKARSQPQYQGMGTTMTIAVLLGRRTHIAHVGDSRAYLCNRHGVTDTQQQIAQLTVDHSLVARLVDIGQLSPDAARTHPQRNIIYRALGGYQHVDVDTQSQSIAAGDVLLLCSDGVTTHLTDTEVAQLVFAAQQPVDVCRQCIDYANERGGSDNIGVALAQIIA